MLRWLAALTVLLVVLAGGAVVLVSHHDPKPSVVPRPGVFYRAPDPLPHGAPGTLLRSQPVTGLPLGEQGWRILYLSHGYDGARAAVSGLVIAPAGPVPRHHRHVVAFAHGTSGVAPRCGPSVLGGAAAPQIDGLGSFIKAGDVVVVPDYQGLGTSGPHPYLVGKAAARNVIDGVRATLGLPAAHAGHSYAVFGESQGGQAAIAVGQLAPRYGRGLTLVGIAAAAPPIGLASLFAHARGTTVGDVITAYTLSSWAQVYDRTNLDDVVTPASRAAVRSIDDYCIARQSELASTVPATLARRVSFAHAHPTRSKAWATLLTRNSLRPFTTSVPMLISQGEDDRFVTPTVTADYVQDLCQRADRVEYRLYPGVGHDTIGASSAVFTTGWIAGRFEARRAPTSCPS